MSSIRSILEDILEIHEGTSLASVTDEWGEIYIFEDDETGVAVADALMKAAKRGVQVYLLLDGYASQHLPDDFITELKTNGVQFRWFEPVFRGRYFYFGRRMHHKILVTDALHSLIGGVNISNRFHIRC